jgi:hypothetical protein
VREGVIDTPLILLHAHWTARHTTVLPHPPLVITTTAVCLMLSPVCVTCASLCVRTLRFVFSWWGVASAAFWVPSGLLTIAGVPLIGMAMQVGIARWHHVCSSPIHNTFA